MRKSWWVGPQCCCVVPEQEGDARCLPLFDWCCTPEGNVSMPFCPPLLFIVQHPALNRHPLRACCLTRADACAVRPQMQACVPCSIKFMLPLTPNITVLKTDSHQLCQLGPILSQILSCGPPLCQVQVQTLSCSARGENSTSIPGGPALPSSKHQTIDSTAATPTVFAFSRKRKALCRRCAMPLVAPPSRRLRRRFIYLTGTLSHPLLPCVLCFQMCCTLSSCIPHLLYAHLGLSVRRLPRGRCFIQFPSSLIRNRN